MRRGRVLALLYRKAKRKATGARKRLEEDPNSQQSGAGDSREMDDIFK